MKLAPTGLGAEPKKLALLVAILVVGGGVVWFQNRPDASVSANVAPATAPAAIPAVKPPPEKPAGERVITERQAESEAARSTDIEKSRIARKAPLGGTGDDTFVPSMKHSDDLDVSKIDPRVNLDLLAKVRAVPMEGGSSSLFDFSKPPEPPAPKVGPINPVPVPVPPPVSQAKQDANKAKATTPPPPPPIPFKYYGYAGKATDGPLQGLFLEGDATTGTIYAKSEGETIKDHYKVVRIGIRSADVEDTNNHNQQTLKLLDEQP